MNGGVRIAGPLGLPGLLLATCLTSFAAVPAGADTRANVLVSGGLRAEANPYLGDDSSRDAIGGSVEVEPSVFFVNEISSFRITGHAQYDLLGDNVRDNQRLRVSANGNTRVDERTSLSANAQFLTSRSYGQDVVFFGTDDLLELEEGEEPVFPEIDPTVVGTGRRITSLNLGASVAHQLSPIDGITVGVFSRFSETSGDFGRDFRTVGTNIGYGRALNERMTLRANVGVRKNDFQDREIGDSLVITPLIGVQQQISPTFSWTAQAGVSYARIDDGLGGTIENTGFAANFDLCRRGLLDSLCVNAGRDARPTTFGGLTTSTSVGAQYSRQVSRDGRIGVTANYRRSERIVMTEEFDDRTDEFVGVNGNYRHQFSRRFSGFIRGAYTKAFSDVFPDREANVTGYFGVSYLFGDVR